MNFVAISVALIIFGSLWAIAGIALDKKLYDIVQKEDHQEKGKIIQKLMKTYALIQCIGYPTIMISAWLLYVNKFILIILQPSMTRYAILILRFMYTTLRSYVGLNSLITATCRYSFIICEQQVFKIGTNRFRSIILSCSVILPIVLAFLNEATHSVEIIWACLFMPHNNQTLQLDLKDVSDIFCSRNHVGEIAESIFYKVYIRYLPTSFTQGMKISHIVFIVIIGSNVLEGFFYCHIFSYLKR